MAKDKTHEFIIKKTITSSEIDDIMTAALEGITYWADEAYVVLSKDATNYTGYTADALSQNHTINIHDMHEDKWHELTLEKFLNGLSLAQNHDYYEYDIHDADSIIQYALFGKLIYG